MTDTAPVESDRIKAWRAERARVAEEQKAQRVLVAAQARAQKQKEEKAARDARAALLIPDDAALTEARRGLVRARDRRRRLLMAQFAAVVLVPMAACLFYLLEVATPLYEARAVVAIATPEDRPAPEAALFQTERSDRLEQAFMAQEYLGSAALMQALEAEFALAETLSSEKMDPLRRLRDLPVLGLSARDRFRHFVAGSVDIQTGLLSLHVRLPDAGLAEMVAQAVLVRTAAHVDSLAAALSDRRVAVLEAALTDAQTGLETAQADLVRLRAESREADPRERLAAQQSAIRDLEEEAQRLDNAIESARLDGIGGRRDTLAKIALRDGMLREIVQRRADLAGAGEGPSLSETLVRHETAELRVEMARDALTAARAGLTEARGAAALSRRMVQVVVPPSAPTLATYPRIPTILAVTLLICLTAFSLTRVLLPNGFRPET
ncbi:MAG: hypothetical protein AAF919_08790 [Pseudomonadota bacterium]